MNYKKWLVEDLQNLERQRFAITQLKEELETVVAEYDAIKATNYDKMPSGSGTNVQEEKLLTAIAKKDELTKKQRKALIKATADGSTERLLCARITEMEKTLESRKNTIKLLRAEIVELKRTF